MIFAYIGLNHSSICNFSANTVCSLFWWRRPFRCHLSSFFNDVCLQKLGIEEVGGHYWLLKSERVQKLLPAPQKELLNSIRNLDKAVFLVPVYVSSCTWLHREVLHWEISEEMSGAKMACPAPYMHMINTLGIYLLCFLSLLDSTSCLYAQGRISVWLQPTTWFASFA